MAPRCPNPLAGRALASAASRGRGGQSPGRQGSGQSPMAAEQDPEGRAAARPLLTDLYQATMALGYWRAGRAQEAAEFELFFRRCPFGGAFALAAGLRDCVRFVRAFRLTDAGSRPPAPRNPRQPPGPAAPASPRHHGLCRPQTCSSWRRCCHQTQTPRSSSIFVLSTAPG